MDGDLSAWVGAVGGAIGAIGGVGAWIVAIRANGRSERANGIAESAATTADKAYDLQARVDARAQEYRDVQWRGEWVEVDPDQGYFRLRNVGHTAARSVTVVVAGLSAGEPERLWSFDHIDPGEYGEAPLGAQLRDVLDEYLSSSPVFEVHWTSPLGAAGQYRSPGPMQLY